MPPPPSVFRQIPKSLRRSPPRRIRRQHAPAFVRVCRFRSVFRAVRLSAQSESPVPVRLRQYGRRRRSATFRAAQQRQPAIPVSGHRSPPSPNPPAPGLQAQTAKPADGCRPTGKQRYSPSAGPEKAPVSEAPSGAQQPVPAPTLPP